MFKNNVKLALRHLWKNKAQSAILIGGLAAGMTACILLLQYVGFELSFDDFHTKKDRIYRVVNERIQEGKSIQKGTITYPTIGAALQNEYPEVANHTRLAPGGEVYIRYEDNQARQDNLLWVDEHFFEIFDFSLLSKSDVTLLKEPNQIVLTRKIADFYFPGAKGNYDQVVGKEVFVENDQTPFKIVGICEDVPANSLLQFKTLASYATFIKYAGQGADDSWTWSDFWHFVELKPGTDVAALEAKLPAFSERHFKGTEVSGSKEIFTLQALKDAHLYSTGLEYEIGATANGKTIWSLLIIAFFILIIAWINYVNLSSVRAIERSREVGVRKVLGARRGALIGQFLTEALMVNALALLIAWYGAELLKPWYAANFDMEGSALTFATSGNYLLPLTMLGLMLMGVVLSGTYPAWLMSSPHVSNILKGAFLNNLRGAGGVRKGLVVFQFTASIGLITATWLVSRQLDYMNHEDLGININQVLTVKGPRLMGWDSTFISKLDAFKDKLQTNDHIKSVSTSNRNINDEWHGRVFQIKKTSDHPTEEQFTSSFITTDYNYAETYGLKPLAGRFFRSTDHNPDFDSVNKIVISQASVKLFGYASNEAAVGQTLNFWNREFTIIGVLPDYHSMSLHHPIESLIFVPLYSTGNPISLRIDGRDTEATIAFVQSTYKDFFPGNVFEYEFVDEAYRKLYEADGRFGNILQFFTMLTILIACLGLFGLASYMTFLRTKEIGIRKVLGASIAGIVGLLSKDFLKLVFLALLFASPLAWYFMKNWLQEYPYRVDIEWWVFIGAGVLAIAIAFLTVSFHSLKAALANPVKSLRSE